LRSSKDLLNSGLSFVFGLFMLILSVIFSFEGDFYPYIFIIFGVTLMLKSKYYIPSAELNIENGFLFLKNNKVQVKVELNTIKEINIFHYYLSVQKNDFEELLFRD
ncbi:hypothetical protein RZS08_40485, partial [Arthrospira platensis SPKY1]|nr:hypothetical protein [Arthrospira platensis SPKY1]